MKIWITVRAALIAGAAAFALSGCENMGSEEAESQSPLSLIDEANLNDLMLQAPPEEGVEYFRVRLQEQPDDVVLKRGYAVSLRRARMWPEARLVYRDLDEAGQLSAEDRVSYAIILQNAGQFQEMVA